MRLVDADVLRARLEGMIKAPWNAQSAPYCWAHAYEAMQEELDNAPTIEAEPVKQPELVHCSECVHCEKSEFAGFWFCDAWDEDVSMAYQDPEKYYCAEGERREL